MSYFKSLVLVGKLVLSPYRCNEFSAKSPLLTRPILILADRPNLRLVGLDITQPVPTSPNLGQNYSRLVYVKHYLPQSVVFICIDNQTTINTLHFNKYNHEYA